MRPQVWAKPLHHLAMNMHELSIAYSLVEVISTTARELGATGVEVVHMRLGTLAGVVKHALLFSFGIATEGSLLAGARLEIEDVPVTIFCSQCQAEFELANIQSFRCPRCDMPSGQIVHGREMDIVGLDVLMPDM